MLGETQEISLRDLFIRYKTPLFFIIIFFLAVAFFLSLKGYLRQDVLDPKQSNLAEQKSVDLPEAYSKASILETLPSFSVDISGAVLKPGVFEVSSSARIFDVLKLAGGLSKDADRDLVEKTINQAQKVSDELKIYIPFKSQLICESDLGETLEKPVVIINNSDSKSSIGQSSSPSSGKTNVNKATLAELDSLPGIGPTYASKIVENRPYKDFDELVTKSKVKKSTLTELKNALIFK